MNMFSRLIKPSKSHSFFIFGARGTGKSTYLSTHFGEGSHVISLLEDQWESRYLKDPDRLSTDLEALSGNPKWIIIDEIQKVPKLLDIVHHLIEKKKYKFILTGSSARKLKRSSANLLAGRAFLYHMFPLTHLELGSQFQLDQVLRWGTLPALFSIPETERAEFLRSYTQVYLKEEILQEQLVRNGLAFREFLDVAAQENGKTLNFTKVARDVGVDPNTIQSFFQILEDTLVGFFLPAFHRSVRKSAKQQPKFYLFDLGVKKALEASLKDGFTPKTSAYGQAFEHFIVCEAYRLNSYFRCDYNLSHYQTSAGGELDLVLKRGRKILAIEIKSSTSIDEVEVRRMGRVADGIEPTEKIYVSQDPVRTQIDDVLCLNWRDFFSTFFPEE